VPFQVLNYCERIDAPTTEHASHCAEIQQIAKRYQIAEGCVGTCLLATCCPICSYFQGDHLLHADLQGKEVRSNTACLLSFFTTCTAFAVTRPFTVLNEILVQENLTWSCCGVDAQLTTPGGVEMGGGGPPGKPACDGNDTRDSDYGGNSGVWGAALGEPVTMLR